MLWCALERDLESVTNHEHDASEALTRLESEVLDSRYLTLSATFPNTHASHGKDSVNSGFLGGPFPIQD